MDVVLMVVVFCGLTGFFDSIVFSDLGCFVLLLVF